MNFYKILKIKKLGRGSPDFWTRLFAKHTGGGSVKPVIVELTGRLPLFFRTSDTKLHDWELYGNNDVGKNLLEITAESQTINGVSFMIDKQAGTITANGIATGNLNMVIGSVYNSSNEPFNYYLSGGADDGSEQSYFIIGTTQVGTRLKRWNGTTDMRGSLSLTDNVEMQIPANETGDIRVYIRNGANADNLVFKPMLRKANTSADFEPYQVGVGEKTKNLLKITGEDELVTRGVTFTHDKSNHTIKVNGQATGNAFYACGEVILKAEVQYVLNGCPAGGSVSGTYTYQLYIAGHSDWGSDTGNGLTLPIMTEDTVVTPRIGVYTGAGELTDLVFKPMVREAGTSADFIPYGYQIPLITMDAKTAEYVYRNNIFIGDSPLTEGESVSKSSTGLDVKTITIGADDYPNKLITSLSNKPEMTIKYKSKGGS